MKVIGINGSPRKNGNTSILIKSVFKELEKEGIETELIQIGGKDVSGCRACMQCVEKQNRRCENKKNVAINACIEKMIEADGIILGSPVYFSNITTEMKALIDCSGYVTRSNGNLLRRKVGAAVVAVRRTGAMFAIDAMNHYLQITQMMIVGASYWPLGVGKAIGDVENDEEAANTMKSLGENMAWLLKKVAE